MRNLKRALASILAVAMLSTSVNVGFAATANFSDVDSKYSAAVTRLAGIDILTGYEDGTFKPEGTITRAEAAAVMVRMLGKEKLASYSAGVSQFSDMTTSHWANGYVNVAASAGLVKGYEDGTFGPEKQVTYAEMVTMMVRAIGAGEAVGSAGTWPNNYLNFALTEGLTDDVAVVPNAPATRGDVAIMANQTLDTTMWEATGYNTDGTRTYAKAEDLTKTLFTEKLELTKYEMYTVSTGLTASSGDYSFTAGKDGADADTTFDNETTVDGTDADATVDSDEVSTFTFADGLQSSVYPGEEVDILTNDDNEVVSIQHAKDSKQKVVSFNDVTSLSGTKVGVELADGSTKTYDFATGAQKLTNGKTTLFAGDADLNLPGRVYLNQNGKVTMLYTYDYNKAFVVKEVKYDEDANKYTIKADTDLKYTNETSLSYDLDDKVVYASTPAGLPISLADIKEGDMVMYSTNGDNNFLMVFPATEVEGTVDAEDADQLSIDGKDYDYSNNITAGRDSIAVDDSVKAYTDPMGQIVTLEKVTAGTSGSGDYGIVTDFYRNPVDGKGKHSVEINIMDLASGVETGLKTFDAENTDDESATTGKVEGFDFYTGTDSTEDLAAPFVADATNSGYANLVGKVVKYDISSDKTTIYKVETDEIATDPTPLTPSSSFDADKDKFTVNTSNYYVDPSSVKVYKATELDAQDNTLKVSAVDYSTLKDSGLTDNIITVVDLDDDMNAAFVYYPLDTANHEQSIAKSNSDNIGVISKVREVTNEDVEVTVVTKDETKKFYVDKDEKDNISTTAINGSTISLDKIDDYAAFKGMLVSYSADADNYVTKDNVNFNHTLQMAKFQELTSRNEVTLLPTTGLKGNKDAYKDMFVVDADITQKAHELDVNAGKDTITLDAATLPFDGETVVVDGRTYEFDSNSYVATGNTPVAISTDPVLATAIAATATDLAAKITAAELAEGALNKDVSATAAANVVSLTLENGAVLANLSTYNAPAISNIAISDVNSIDAIDDAQTDYVNAHKVDEASTVYYYMVGTDSDDEFENMIDSDAVMVIIYDSNEF